MHFVDLAMHFSDLLLNTLCDVCDPLHQCADVLAAKRSRARIRAGSCSSAKPGPQPSPAALFANNAASQQGKKPASNG